MHRISNLLPMLLGVLRADPTSESLRLWDALWCAQCTIAGHYRHIPNVAPPRDSLNQQQEILVGPAPKRTYMQFDIGRFKELFVLKILTGLLGKGIKHLYIHVAIVGVGWETCNFYVRNYEPYS